MNDRISSLTVNRWLVESLRQFVVSQVIVLICLTAFANELIAQPQRFPNDDAKLAKIPFDGKASYEVLKKICAMGPRITGSPAMLKQRELLIEHFKNLGAEVSEQKFEVLNPLNGEKTPVVNLIVRWYPEKKNRLLICCHYDTRPFPDQDPVNPKGLFLGANDGASGVAVLHELGRHMPKINCQYGVDFVFFDAEEFVYVKKRDPLFVGSTLFSRAYIKEPRDFNYVSGVLLDMVGDRYLQIYYEKNSMRYAPTLTRGIWNTARKLGVVEFIQRQRHTIRDDHLPLNEIAKIPTTDIIDFDFPTSTARQKFWHTTKDVPENCSALSLAKVGWVMKQWLIDVR